MSTVIATPISQIKLAPGSAMTLAGLNWQIYVALLQQLGDDRSTRLAYDQGVLEIRMPGEPHEIINRLLAKIITLLAMELGMEVNDCGSTTLNRESLDRGVEPDSCFYIQNATVGQGLTSNATESLAPDLVLEVDIANSSASKIAIYQAMAVPEIWLFRRSLLKIQRLEAGQYVEVEYSPAFPILSTQQLNRWIELRRTATDAAVLRDVQQFCKAR